MDTDSMMFAGRTDSTLSLQYLARLQDMLTRAVNDQQAAIQTAAEWIAASLQSGGLLHVFGTGHSHLMVEELYGRAGGLTPVNAILIPSLMLHEDMTQSTLLEREAGLAQEVLRGQPLRPGDVMLVISNSGRNGLSVEVARLARAQGLKVIALSAVEYSATLASRHPDGLHLYEAADLALSNLGQAGDACLELPGSGLRSGATSTVIGAAVLNAVVLEVINQFVSAGSAPPVFISANIGAMDDHSAVDALKQAGRRLK